MTETPGSPIRTPTSAELRREAKQRAWDCFFTQGNSLTLIAATLIPVVMYMITQGIYSLAYYAIGPWNTGEGSAAWLSALNVILTLTVIPLIGGTMYIVTGLAKGEYRHIRGVFYAYSSPSAYFRTWISLLIPCLMLASVVGISAVIVKLSQGLAEMALASKATESYGSLFLDSGIFFAIVAAVIGLAISGYILPFFWLAFSHPEQSVGMMFVRSVSLAHRRLGAWLLLQLSFLGWFLLSVATVGILLVLFTIPYYLLSVTLYLAMEEDRLPDSDKIYE